MRLGLGRLVSALEGWVLCVEECSGGCTMCVQLPRWANRLSDDEKLYLALYLAARKVLDYRLAAAMHVWSVRNRVVLRPELLARALREARVESRVPPAIEDECPYAWEAVLYRGILYAHQVLDLEKPVVVRVEPPSDKRAREKLRVLLEGKRVTVNGKTYRVGGLIKRLRGEKLAPWVYLIPKKNTKELKKHGISFQQYSLL